MAENQPSRKKENIERAMLLALGIIVLSTVVGLGWGNVTGNASGATAFLGSLIGIIIVMTVALARTK